MLVPTESLVTKNTHVKHQSSSNHCSKVIGKVKVKLQGQGHSVKNNDTHGKVLSQEILNIETSLTSSMLSCTISNIIKIKLYSKSQCLHSI